MFQGALPEPQVRQYIEELLRVAGGSRHRRLRGSASGRRNPLWRRRRDSRWDRAADAVEAGDWDEAISLYEQLKEVDAEQAEAAIAQVSLVRRTEGVDPAAAIAQADADPLDLAKAKVAADLEVAGGSPEAAFDRLLAVVRRHERR